MSRGEEINEELDRVEEVIKKSHRALPKYLFTLTPDVRL
jgi:hypothetical protein